MARESEFPIEKRLKFRILWWRLGK